MERTAFALDLKRLVVAKSQSNVKHCPRHMIFIF